MGPERQIDRQEAASPLAADVPFQLTVDAVVDYAVFMLDAHGRITTWNRGAERIKGYSADEVRGRHFSIFYRQDDIESGLPAAELTTASLEGRFEDEGWRVRKDGTRLWVRITITAIRDEQGQLIGFCKVTRDLTRDRDLAWQKRELLAVEARAALMQLRSITDSLSDGIIDVDTDWIVQFGNRAAATMLPDFGVGKDLWSSFPDLIGTPVEDTLRRSMRERSYTTYENFYPPYELWLRVRVSPSERGIAIAFSDITHQKKLEARVQLENDLREKRAEALSHMAAGLAHEISNPLAIIHATASEVCLELTNFSDERARWGIGEMKTIVQLADRASRILKGLRGFAREAGQDPMEYASVHSIVSECVDMLQSRFDREGVGLEIDLPANLPPFLCRATQIGQIVTNLLNNAFDAITHAQPPGLGPDRWVRVEARSRMDSIVIAVLDSGPGVEDRYRGHIMEAFFTTKSKGLGMGIGLSLSRAIAEAHGGTLALASHGAPTRMELTLPLVQPVEGSPPAIPKAQA